MAKQTFTTGQVLTAAQVNSLQANDFNQTVSVKTANYTLAAADKGTRIEFNTSGSVTCTVNSGLFDAGDTLVIQNRGAGTATITAGTATVNTSASLALAQYSAGTLYFVSDSAALFFGDAAGISASIVDAKGDLIVGTADNTVGRLAVGTNGYTLVAKSSEATGLAWEAPVTGSMTLLHTLTLNATSTTQSTISQAYKNLYIVGKNIGVTSGGDALRIRFAGRTGNYQGTRIEQANITALSASGVDSVANDLSSTNGSAFHFTCFDYTETASEKLITGQSVGNNTGATCFYNISPFNLQTNIASVTITTVGGTLTMSGTVEIYGVN
jgi:hypothetical protein